MQLNSLTDNLCVMGQISPGDVRHLKDAGFTTIICNRPDGERPDQCAADEVKAAAEELGVTFHHIPISPGAPTPEAVEAQGKAIAAADGKVLAYCGSGQRATTLWMLANPHGLDADERIRRAADAGYDLALLRSRL